VPLDVSWLDVPGDSEAISASGIHRSYIPLSWEKLSAAGRVQGLASQCSFQSALELPSEAPNPSYPCRARQAIEAYGSGTVDAERMSTRPTNGKAALSELSLPNLQSSKGFGGTIDEGGGWARPLTGRIEIRSDRFLAAVIGGDLRRRRFAGRHRKRTNGGAFLHGGGRHRARSLAGFSADAPKSWSTSCRCAN
jgi:hypothetical protein